MIRFTTLTFALLLSFTLAACGSSNNAVKANTNPTTPEASTETTEGGGSTGTSKLKKAENGNMERAEQDE